VGQNPGNGPRNGDDDEYDDREPDDEIRERAQQRIDEIDQEVRQEQLSDVSGVGEKKATSLRDAGYRTKRDLRVASEPELKAVTGIGAGTVASLKADVRPDDEHAPNPEQDISRFRAGDDPGEAIENYGGFTLHRDLQFQEPGTQDVWLIGMTANVQEELVTKDDVIDVYKEYQDELRDFTGVRIGGYEHDDDSGYAVEVTAALTDQQEARELAEDLDQERIFNIGSWDEIYIGGDGDSPIDSAESLRDCLTNIESLAED
jgi:hypothetical protein